MEKHDVLYRCALCSVQERVCTSPQGTGPDFCPTLHSPKKVFQETLKEYKKEEIREFARQSSIQEAECYAKRDIKPFVALPTKPRVQEIIEFARKMGFKKLGIAFCGGLKREAGILHRLLLSHGFQVVSAICKVGRTPKEEIGIKEHEKIHIGDFEAMCSPIGQAKLLNHAGTQLNIAMGLCVGHDSLFFKYSQAPTTVLVAKDRVMGHNPVAALYTINSYSRRLKNTDF